RPGECRAEDHAVIDASVVELAPAVGTAAACRALSVSRSSVYRRRSPRPVMARFRLGRGSHRALSVSERTTVLDALHSDCFVNDSPAQIYATLLDEGTYLASQAPCTASWRPTVRSVSVVINCVVPTTPSPN